MTFQKLTDAAKQPLFHIDYQLKRPTSNNKKMYNTKFSLWKIFSSIEIIVHKNFTISLSVVLGVINCRMNTIDWIYNAEALTKTAFLDFHSN